MVRVLAIQEKEGLMMGAIIDAGLPHVVSNRNLAKVATRLVGTDFQATGDELELVVGAMHRSGKDLMLIREQLWRDVDIPDPRAAQMLQERIERRKLSQQGQVIFQNHIGVLMEFHQRCKFPPPTFLAKSSIEGHYFEVSCPGFTTIVGPVRSNSKDAKQLAAQEANSAWHE